MLRTCETSLFLMGLVLASACVRSPDVFELNQSGTSARFADSAYAPSPWVYADLRAFDPPDAVDPAADVVAAYVRFVGSSNDHGSYALRFPGVRTNELQIRLDFIDLTVQTQCDIYLILDHKPGGSITLPWGPDTRIEWDTLVRIPATGLIEAWDHLGNPAQNLALRVERDSTLDLLAISLSTQALPGVQRGVRIQVFTTLPGDMTIADVVAPFRSDSFPPIPASILFAFWNSFPAYTPAQALRRWDGAHTGPLGGRHGLYNLLRSARSASIPLLMLDLKSPASLAALDYIDGLPLVRKMASEGLLVLPETIPSMISSNQLPDDFQSQAAVFSRTTSLAFGLPASQFLFAPLDIGLPGNYPFVLVKIPESFNRDLSPHDFVRAYRWREKLVFPIPGYLSSGQATREGFSLQARTELVLAALAANEPGSQRDRAILVLGGDLPSSEWGDPQIARAAFSYLKSHPWMQVLDAHDLVSMRTTRNFAGSQALSVSQTPDERSEMISTLVQQLMGLSPSLLRQNAWQALFSLSAPAFPATEELAGLREIYLGQVNTLIEAARWSTNPQPISTCEVDLDLDQQPECILASDRVFIVTELDSGAIVYAFARSESGVHQIIAPSAQFAVGTSSPAGWVLTRGLGADPDVIPGAFADDDGPYSFSLGENSLTLVGYGIVKTYQLSSHGLMIQYQSNHPVSTQIPIALDPWVRFSPAWGDRYSSVTTTGVWAWELQDSLRVFIKTNAIAQPSSFTDTRKYVSSTEDPNRDYPPGHYLPFPLSIVSIQSAGDFYADIQWEYVY